MDTSKIKIKKVNKQGGGSVFYINAREREHIGIYKGDDVVVDMTVPYELRLVSIKNWKKKYGGPDDAV